jgi:hypothetical protein
MLSFNAFADQHLRRWTPLAPAAAPYADLGNPQTLNLCAYVKNNPMNLDDPTGHQAEDLRVLPKSRPTG